MSLAYKLYSIGKIVSSEEIKEIIEASPKDKEKFITLQIDFQIEDNRLKNVEIKKASLDNLKTFFTKKIGGTSNSYYLYPNFEYQKEDNLYKKFKFSIYTLTNSLKLYANEEHKELIKPIIEYIENYKEDNLNLKTYPKDNYLMIFTINGKTFVEAMPEVVEKYFDNFVETHIKKKEKEDLYEAIDFITGKKSSCGYNPNVKFFTMDNYHPSFKPQIIQKLPLSKESASAIKKGWMYAINYLKFNYKNLEYIIIPSVINNDKEIYKKVLRHLKHSTNKLENIASKEDSFIRRLSKQIEELDENVINQITLDILFTEVNRTNLSVKIFATLEDVIPSRINFVVKKMKEFNIIDDVNLKGHLKDKIYLRNYFGQIEQFAKAVQLNTLKNAIRQEKIELAKLLLGVKRINYRDLLEKFEKYRETKYNFKEKKQERRLINSKKGDAKVKEWLEYPNNFVESEDKVYQFLRAIDAVKE